jgi:hypothetical protein
MVQASLKRSSLSAFAHNVYSQHGEDGIVAKIFETIGTRTRLCVEFGAWDGFHLSNTANLWTNGWSGILIEANAERFKTLQKNVEGHGCKAIRAVVGISGENSLEAILKREGVSDAVDLLSIDIDGDDYHVFQSLTMRPRVIIVEHNPTIPAHLELVQEPGGHFGCSSLALVRLAEKKGYRIVALTGTNCIFVTDEEFGLFKQFETSFEELSTWQGIYVMTGYAGDYVLSTEPYYGLTRPSKQKLLGEHCQIDPASQIDFVAETLLNNPIKVSSRAVRLIAKKFLRR